MTLGGEGGGGGDGTTTTPDGSVTSRQRAIGGVVSAGRGGGDGLGAHGVEDGARDLGGVRRRHAEPMPRAAAQVPVAHAPLVLHGPAGGRGAAVEQDAAGAVGGAPAAVDAHHGLRDDGIYGRHGVTSEPRFLLSAASRSAFGQSATA